MHVYLWAVCWCTTVCLHLHQLNSVNKVLNVRRVLCSWPLTSSVGLPLFHRANDQVSCSSPLASCQEWGQSFFVVSSSFHQQFLCFYSSNLSLFKRRNWLCELWISAAASTVLLLFCACKSLAWMFLSNRKDCARLCFHAVLNHHKYILLTSVCQMHQKQTRCHLNNKPSQDE